MKLNIPTRSSVSRKPKEVYADFVMDIHNKVFSVYDVRTALSKLNTLDNFGFIVSRRLLTSINVPYEMSEMNYDQMLSEPNSAQAVFIYQLADAVMVKKSEQPIQ